MSNVIIGIYYSVRVIGEYPWAFKNIENIPAYAVIHSTTATAISLIFLVNILKLTWLNTLG